TELTLHGTNVVDISALSNMAQLTELVLLSNDEISDYTPLNNLAGLNKLSLLYVTLDTLPTLTNPSLQQLTLRSNQLTDISGLSGLTLLTHLSMRNNKLADLSPLSGLSSLTHLTARSNEIVDISPLSGLSALVEMDLSGNAIVNVEPLSVLRGLTSLNIGGNPVSDISAISGLTALTEFYAAGNGITDITALMNLTALSELWLGNNDINDISSLSNLSVLSTLSLYHNKISVIPALDKMKGLAILGLAQNQLTEVSWLAGLNGLKNLDLRENKITDVSGLATANLSALTDLNLAYNQLVNLSGLEAVPSLTTLELRDNNIHTIYSLFALTNLATLTLYHNDAIECVDLTALVSKLSLTTVNHTHRCAPVDPPQNAAPTAHAGPDVSVVAQTEVILAGSGSDSDGEISSYHWRQTAGTAVTFIDADVAAARFTAPAVSTDETLTFELTVTDDEGASATDSVNIVVQTSATVVLINEIVFADQWLRACVTVQANNKGWTTVEQMTSLSCWGDGIDFSQAIMDISGIEHLRHLPELFSLSLPSNQIIDISALYNLHEVDIDLDQNGGIRCVDFDALEAALGENYISRNFNCAP
ncbi:MAG: internalin A, partial [Phenylobacterium sp.]